MWREHRKRQSEAKTETAIDTETETESMRCGTSLFRVRTQPLNGVIGYVTNHLLCSEQALRKTT